MWSPPRPTNLGEKEDLIHKTKCCHLRIFTFSIKIKMCISFGKDRSKLKLFKDVFLRPQISILSLGPDWRFLIKSQLCELAQG